MKWIHLIIFGFVFIACAHTEIIFTVKSKTDDNEESPESTETEAGSDDKNIDESKLDALTLSTRILEEFKPGWYEAMLTMPSDKYIPPEEDAQEILDQLPPLEDPEPLSPDQEFAIKSYETAMNELKKSNGNKKSAYTLLGKAMEMGHVGAKAQLGWGIIFGEDIYEIEADAKTLFMEAAEKGDPDGHTGLGFLYAAGLGVNVSQPKALVHYTMGAIGGNLFAQQILGYRYWAGLTVPSSCETALDFYREVAAKVASEVTFSGGPAIHRIRLLDELENLTPGPISSDLIDYYQLLAEKGDIPAQVGLGQLHYQGGRGVALDINKALEYFTQASKAGNAVAMAFLGKIYLEGGGSIKADNETAFRYFMKAAELKNPLGQSGLGLMYLEGRGVPQDVNKARHYFTLAAEQGWVDGQLQLANMYFGGIGVRRDFKLANKYYSLASQSGHVLAYYHLAQMHAQGMGTFRSCTTAVELFKNVCERGKWGSRFMSAHTAYRDGEINSAFVQYAFMAELGYEVAQSNAAYLLDSGEVNLFESQDEVWVRALQYWSRAAAQGYSPARVKLGDYHYYGLGTPSDFEAAATHYRIASEQQHNAQATFNLGYMHERGFGLSKDWHLAKRCYDLAAEQSPHAKIPAALALAYLNFNVALGSLHESPLAMILLTGESTLLMNWDIYLISVLLGALALVLYFRRNQQN